MPKIYPKTLITIVGPTAIGKTALSIKLAQHFKAKIISADSRQFYKEMSIGTAVPSVEELNAAPHHFIQHKSIDENYNVGDFESDAISKIKELHQDNPVVIMVGGSGLYVKAVTKGLDYFPEVDSNIRESLNLQLEKEGLNTLQEQLNVLDPEAFKTIAIDNPQRVIRALEICIGTGKPYTSFLTNPEKNRDFKTISIGLNAKRSVIYDRINQRVDLMIENGLLEEAKALLPKKHLNALNTVGYKELFEYFEGNDSLDFAVSEIKKNTRRFAKRQLTWFRKDDAIKWFDYKTDANAIIQYIESNHQK
ncbi:tRNA (adenosine(37)-N6)-dimethylallyltransferase MiaA [Winogradskyella psychrotolerans]|uniref:tRNA (adenosine(37)-N6)-dimethylallyltransferase MiaA n=1 Tax=Winogradskyella psychrotolerans TaxID=1344585 RepID=UPI001C06AEDD|nr:tRNA (adenosine(37)-N6)-dimethylallyltransferase MiaA [Winogradskyella psychrotolerans]MBU2920361.1 tRNA (adenosine(37)-N6)-dimethylallyltransferase MiaA [Winogradskyella psychrotolerans]